MQNNLEQAEALYATAEVQKYQVGDATIAVRIYGSGPALVFIHGYPVNGYTWRKLLPVLSENFTCYLIDLPGFGESEWDSNTDFTFTAQARRLNTLFNALALSDYSIIAHDTGASIARLAVLEQPEPVVKLILLNTEIPKHRPPWIQFYQFCAKLPLSALTFKTLMRSKWFLRSSMGFKQFYADQQRFKDEHPIGVYLKPLMNSVYKMQGMLNYLIGIEWSIVDDFETRHKEIKADTLFLWGECDQTFPMDLGEAMLSQFDCHVEFVPIKNASLMPHEEQPDQILTHLIDFLRKPKL